MRFLLVGNAPYTNRGCEAIVRGTMNILRKTFGDDIAVTNASFGSKELIEQQARNEPDHAITNVHLHSESPRFSKRWFIQRLNQRLGASIGIDYPELEGYLNDASFALEIGGDNYSLEYGEPWKFFELDWFLMKHRLPVAIWGASVGPFKANPSFESRAKKHLRKLAAIFARETESQSYLESIGIAQNVQLTCDPSFAMTPKLPPVDKVGFSFPDNAVGLNVSPLMAKFVTGGDQDQWLNICVETVKLVIQGIDRPVVLIPHVSSANPISSDDLLLQKIAEKVPAVLVVPDTLDAEETKGIISKCAVFCGARTHSTLAAISTCVPTLSLAYSIKARGLNKDVYGSQDFCIDPTEITPELVKTKILKLYESRNAVADQIRNRVPSMTELAYKSGATLKALIDSRNA